MKNTDQSQMFEVREITMFGQLPPQYGKCFVSYTKVKVMR